MNFEDDRWRADVVRNWYARRAVYLWREQDRIARGAFL